MRLTRAALTGLVLGAVTLSPLVAQAQPPTGAKAPIEIKEEAPKKAPEAAAPKEAAGQKKAVSTRDPFVNYSASGGGVVTKTEGAGSSDLVKKNDKKDAAKKADPAKPAVKEVEIPPPAVTVQGIVLSGSGNRAILTSPNQTYIVRTGDKLGDYKVDKVEAKTVIFRFKDKTFKLTMADEFSAAGKSGGKKK